MKRALLFVAVFALLAGSIGLGFWAAKSSARELAAETDGFAGIAPLAPETGADPDQFEAVEAGPVTPPDPSIGPVVAESHGKAASFDKDLRDLPQVGIPAQAKRPSVEMPSPFRGGATSAVDPVAQTAAGTLAAMPASSTSFKGLDLSTWGAGWPPDTNGDVGPNHFIQTVNTSIGVYDKAGNRLAAFTFDTFFDKTGTPCDASNQGDPVVLYDQVSGRWIITDFAWSSLRRGPWYECIAVSKTADPVSGGWWMYGITASTTAMNDYPKLGVWGDGIYMSANMFKGANTFNGVKIWALNRNELINGLPLNPVTVTLGTAYFSLLPGNARVSMPAAGTPEYFASVSTGSFQLWKFSVNWTNKTGALTGPVTVPIASFTKFGSRIPQKGSTETLDALGDRGMVQLQYANASGSDALWLTHTVTSGSVTGIRWYEVRNLSTTPAVYQQGTYQPDSSYRWMPSLAVDKQGNMAVGYSVSSASLYPAIRYAGRLASDPLNNLGQTETLMIEGTGSQSSGYNRWGDYAAMNIDPTDGCTFWFTTEYYETTGNNWQTRIGSFKYPGCQ